jgi:hypothetical protein
MAELMTAWPAMAVHPVKLLKQWLTADEVASGVLTLDDGSSVSFQAIDLPPTPVAVHRGAALAILFGAGEIATVAPCTASGGGVTVSLDAEPVVVENGAIVAKAMPATAKAQLPDGRVFTSVGVPQPDGYGGFPDCPLVGGVAQPVVAKFKMMQV